MITFQNEFSMYEVDQDIINMYHDINFKLIEFLVILGGFDRII